MSKRSGRSLQEEILIAASPTHVYEAWADPKKISAWFVDHASDWAMPQRKVAWRFDDSGYEVPMQVVEAVPGHRLVLRDEHGGASRRTDISFAAVDDSTRVRLTCHGFPADRKFDEDFSSTTSSTISAARAKTCS
jgi:uncharacterized protein YndB with AHSA1/START domain